MQKIGTPGAASQNWAFFACALRRTKPPVRREKTSSSEPSDTGLSGAFAAALMASTSLVFFSSAADLAGRACVRALRACLAWITFWAGTHANAANKTTSALPALFLRIHAALHRNLNARTFVAGKCNLGIWARTGKDEKADCTGKARRWR
jgi:hypothetical protein